eukprot:TRINITY_DN24_c0_g1_i3.p3 TRINITY_DN24_c0_g1~~TRINITY_DN24_c0_g1_i3.p3  ORF type:complete len:205 (+),score=-62.94 TRINITY_DN24_c0_g1_i3:1761-2375(+)
MPLERSPTTEPEGSIHSFGDLFSPGKFSAQGHSTSELLRTLQMMAASEPTSQLSVQPHILFHLTDTLGPQLVVWAVSLLTTDLITRSLTPGSKSMAFGVYLNSVTREGPLVQTVLYLHDSHIRGQPQSYFGENQLSPSSIGISPLPTPHPRTFQRAWVRSSSAYYRTFNLDMGRSLGFGSTTSYLFALFRLAFAAAPSFQLNLA